MATDRTPALSRRGLLRSGTLTVALGALAAACSREAAAPGRVGNAPVPTPLPEEPVDDAVYLRTATSMHMTVNDLYTRLLERDALDEAGVALIERFISDHEEAISTLSDMTAEAGGEPYECTNTWYEERVLTPLFERLDGNEAADIAPSDDIGRDILELAYAFESVLGATHQRLVEQLSSPEMRREVIGFGALAARHSAAVAILRTGAPEGYISPVLYGEELEVEDGEIPPLHAVTARFGSLAPVPVFIGGLTPAGGRFEGSVETPAENSFVYASLTCDA